MERNGIDASYSIRRAVGTDAPELGEMLYALKVMNGSCSEPTIDSFLSKYGRGIQMVLADGRSTIWVADKAGKAVGMLSAGWRPVMRMGGLVGSFEEMYVMPDHRRRGLATTLWKTALADLAEKGVRVVEGVTSLAHPGQRSFAKLVGFEYYSTVHRVWINGP